MTMPLIVYRSKPCSYGFSPIAVSHPVTSPVEPRVAMNRKASGTPPKLANTPDAVITTRRSRLPRLAVKIA